MDQHEPVKRRKTAEAIDTQTKDPAERTRKSSATPPKDDIHASNDGDEGLTDDNDLDQPISSKKPTVERSARAVNSSRPVERVRQVQAKVSREVSSAKKKVSAQKIDKGVAMDDVAVDNADATTTDDSSSDGPHQRSRDVKLPDNDEEDDEDAPIVFPGPDNIKLIFAGRALKVCNAQGKRNRSKEYDFPLKVQLELCQYMVRNNYLHGSKRWNRSTLDRFYDEYNLRDRRKLARARKFFIGEIDWCAKTFTSQILEADGTHNETEITPAGEDEVIRYSRGYDYLLSATARHWDGTMKRNFYEVAEAQDAVRASIEDVLQLRDTFQKLQKKGADTPTLADPPTSRPQWLSVRPDRMTPTRMADILAFLNDGTAQQLYLPHELSQVRSFSVEQLKRVGLKVEEGSSGTARSGEPQATDRLR